MKNQGIPIISGLLSRVIGTRNERFVKRYLQRVDAISALEDKTRQMSDEQLRSMHGEFRRRHDEGATEDELMVEVFAVAREAMDRAVGIRSIFSPEFGEEFDPSRLAPPVRELFEKTKAEMAELPDAPSEGELLGNAQAVGSWLWHPIPNEIYEAVRGLYPESRRRSAAGRSTCS